MLKVYQIVKDGNNRETLEFDQESDIFSQRKYISGSLILNIFWLEYIFIKVSATYFLKKNFIYFELLNEHQVLVINNNQSFVILHDLKSSDLNNFL